jgi:homogentisate 1,2-dioxygenase
MMKRAIFIKIKKEGMMHEVFMPRTLDVVGWDGYNFHTDLVFIQF